MDFISFVLNNENEDSEMQSFSDALRKFEGVPNSSDPRLLGRYLYRKLNASQTFGFQKWFLRYKSLDKENEIPEDIKEEKDFLVAINLITILQNSDPDCK